MSYGKVEEPSSSRSRSKSMARFAATSAILTVTLSRSDRAPASRKANSRPGLDADLSADGARLPQARECRKSTRILPGPNRAPSGRRPDSGVIEETARLGEYALRFH